MGGELPRPRSVSEAVNGNDPMRHYGIPYSCRTRHRLTTGRMETPYHADADVSTSSTHDADLQSRRALRRRAHAPAAPRELHSRGPDGAGLRVAGCRGRTTGAKPAWCCAWTRASEAGACACRTASPPAPSASPSRLPRKPSSSSRRSAGQPSNCCKPVAPAQATAS